MRKKVTLRELAERLDRSIEQHRAEADRLDTLLSRRHRMPTVAREEVVLAADRSKRRRTR